MNELDDAIAQLKKVDCPIKYDHYGTCTTCGDSIPVIEFRLTINEDGESMPIRICKKCAGAIQEIAREKEEEHDRED